MSNAAAGLANRMLRREHWARQRLAVHAGRSFAVVSGPVVTAMRIDDTGLLASCAPADGAPDLRLVVPPWAIPGLLSDPAHWDGAVTADGDAALAATLRELAQTTPFWAEQLFSQWLGPIAGQRAAEAGRHVLALPGHAAERVADSVASYLRDETGLFASAAEGRVFAGQIAALADRVDALAARIAALAANGHAHVF